MYRQFSQPLRANYETEEEYQEALDAYDEEYSRREEYYRERYYERKYGIL